MSKMILVRGLPGSGKSTIAKSFIGFKHFEADMYWMVDGEYKFDRYKLKNAHDWCHDMTLACLQNNEDVVVSNTFTTKKEMEVYFSMAKVFGIVPQVILCQAQYGNIHDVPEETLAKMKARFQYDISDLYT